MTLGRRIVSAGVLGSIADATAIIPPKGAESTIARLASQRGARPAGQVRQLLIEFLIALTIPLTTFSALRLLRFSTIPAVDSAAYGGLSKYSHVAAVLVILATAIVAFTALAIESRRRKVVESALLETEARVSLCAEATDIGLWQWNSASNEFKISDHCRDLLRLPRGTAFSLGTILDAVHPEDRDVVEHSIQRGAQSGSGFDVEFRLLPMNERIRWLRLRASPARGSDGNVSSMTGTILDVTDRSEMKMEIERQRESLAHLTRVSMIGKLSSALAHELNQPLTAIMSNAQAAQRIMTKLPLDVTELKATISDIIQDDARAGDVIRHLRTMLKNNADFFEELDLNTIVASALELTRGDLVARHISLAIHPWQPPLFIKGDSVQLQQVVLNLVLNAAEAISQAGERDGSILVTSTALPDGYACVSVSDNGPGIEAEHFSKLFDPFFSTKEGGMGLGLSISRSIVMRHRGQMWAANRNEKGATFYFSVPLVRSNV